MTDGEATDSVKTGMDAIMELEDIAPYMNIPNTEWIVIDSSLVPGKINYALNLSKIMGARYIRLEDLQYV
jgi:Mg-chelatase subunit ChlD